MRVVDFSTHLSGPLASSLLRDLGAEVVKVEHPRTGDGLRDLPPLIAGVGKYHPAVNAGARSLAVSTRSPHWPEVVAACARWADIVIVGSRPEEARRRGLDFASLCAVSPRLVYCAITGYGTDGPWSGLPAHGQNVDAMAGLLPVEWVDGQPTTPPGWRSTGTTLAGVFAALGALGGLHRQRVTGQAQFVAVSMWASAMWWSWRDLNLLANNGTRAVDYQSFGSRYAMYATRDGRAILVCPIERKFWERFCDVVGLPEGWRSRGRWGEGSHADYGSDDERPTIAGALAAHDLAHWVEVLGAADVPFAPVLEVEEAMASAHAEANGVMRPVRVGDQQVVVAASPVRPPAAPDDPVPAAPGIGEHTDELLEELGLGHLAGGRLAAPGP